MHQSVTVDGSGNLAKTDTYLDGLYRTIRQITHDPEGNISVDTEYDGKGRVDRVSNPYRR